MDADIKEIDAQVKDKSLFIQQLMSEMGTIIVGQHYLLESMIMALLADGHVLLEGVPGLAKTLSVKTLAQAIKVDFKRIQFTPDLLPADIIGTQMFDPKSMTFNIKNGPVFTNFVLADEINRSPAKVQSALLEAMQERQVTIGDTTFDLPKPFLVLATQNPIEQEGTYPLPEAQVDRFMFKIKLDYPNKKEERLIMDRMTTGEILKVNHVIGPEEIHETKKILHQIYLDERIRNYIVDIVMATRDPKKAGLKGLDHLIQFGGSPRATIYLNLAARAQAFVEGRGYVTPEDVKSIGHDVLRHRLILTYEAEAESIDSDDILKKIFSEIEVP